MNDFFFNDVVYRFDVVAFYFNLRTVLKDLLKPFAAFHKGFISITIDKKKRNKKMTPHRVLTSQCRNKWHAS